MLQHSPLKTAHLARCPSRWYIYLSLHGHQTDLLRDKLPYRPGPLGCFLGREYSIPATLRQGKARHGKLFISHTISASLLYCRPLPSAEGSSSGGWHRESWSEGLGRVPNVTIRGLMGRAHIYKKLTGVVPRHQRREKALPPLAAPALKRERCSLNLPVRESRVSFFFVFP